MKDRAETREGDLHREISNLSDSLRRQKEHEADTVRSYDVLCIISNPNLLHQVKTTFEFWHLVATS